ncbi:hypothetical protein BC941DRAFT_440124 [Chlamydoabsidia padenii]|nr:hypothetical protein BC941DRAFT_440124 [Chlamydoabsidia padenii]
MNILDLKTMTWSMQYDVPPRYNHSATLVNNKMYIYGGKDEHGNTVSDLFVIPLTSPHYTCHLVLDGSQNKQMVLLKSQHFCDAVCGKLVVFGRFLAKSYNGLQQANNNNNDHLGYSLWMVDLDTLEWQQLDCDAHFQVGGWNYFTIIKEDSLIQPDQTNQVVSTHHLLFLGNTDPYRPQGYDHFRDALVINVESLGLYDITPSQCLTEFASLLDNPELSDFIIVPSDGKPIHAHQVILMSRWPHFRNMYNSGMMESQERRITIPESHQVVMAFLHYLYTDQLDENETWQVICELLVVANMYLQHRLVKLCCQRLYQRHLTISSCGVIFEKAMLSDETGLKLLTLDYMFRHYGSVVKSNVLMHLSPSVQHTFMEAVPVEAVLGRSRCLSFAATTHNKRSHHPMDLDDTSSSSSSSSHTIPQHYMTSSSSSVTLSPSSHQSLSSGTSQRIAGVTGIQRTPMASGLHTNSVEV